MSTPICPDQEHVVKIWVGFYKSIWLTGLQYIDYWFLTNLLHDSTYLKMPWWFDIENISSRQESTIGVQVNSHLFGYKE